jgi:uncharacterized protein YcfL
MKKIIASLFLVLLISCSAEDKIPKDVLPVSKMQPVIWDMSLADNLASEKYTLNRDSQRMMVTGLYQKIFRLHKINKAAFYKSYAYYEAHPVILQTLFDSVSAYGTRQKAKAYQTKLKIP